MLGLPHGTVKLAPPSPLWSGYYTTEAAQLERAIGQYTVEICHIGSTAIPNIWAKPIIDIMAGLADSADIAYCIAPLQTIGYTYMGEQNIPGWHFFTKGHPHLKTHHLHVVAWGSEYWNTHLLFLDYLCTHQEIAAAYEDLKLQLARHFPQDRDLYTHNKAEFIQTVIKMARQDLAYMDHRAVDVLLPETLLTLA